MNEALGKREYVDHPKAGQPVPVTRENIGQIRGRVSEQIEDAIDEANAPPEELMEVRDDDGNVVEEEEHSPTEENYAAR